MASVSFYSPYVGTRDGQGCADSGGLSASAGLAATLASAGLSLPWLGSTPGYAYPLIAPPGRGASATGPPSGAPPGAAGRWAAAPGFDGLFRPREASAKPQEEIFGSAAGDAVRQQQQQQQQQQPQLQQRQQLLQQQEQQRQRSWLGKALEESPAGLATATASASSSPGVAVAMPEGILHVRVLAAHRLVNRDTGLFGDVSDPYVAVRASGKESAAHRGSPMQMQTPRAVGEVYGPDFPGNGFGDEFMARMAEAGSLYAVAKVRDSEDSEVTACAMLTWDGSVGLVGGVATRPVHRRQGLSKQLVGSILHWFDNEGCKGQKRNADGIHVVLGTTSRSAAKIYAGFGFVGLNGGLGGSDKGYNPEDEGEWIMVRDSSAPPIAALACPHESRNMPLDMGAYVVPGEVAIEKLARCHWAAAVLLLNAVEGGMKLPSLQIDDGVIAELRLAQSFRDFEAITVAVHLATRRIYGVAFADPKAGMQVYSVGPPSIGAALIAGQQLATCVPARLPTSPDCAKFWEQGYLVFEGLLAEEAPGIREKMGQAMKTADHLGRSLTADWNAVNTGGAEFVLAKDEAGSVIPNRILKIQAAALACPAVLEVLGSEKVGAKVREFYGFLGQAVPEHVDVFGTKFFPMLPGRTSVSWHQDCHYFGTGSPWIISCGVYLEDTDAQNGCLQVVPGSHLHGKLPHKPGTGEFSQGEWLSENPSGLEVDVVVPAGSVVLFNAMLVHGARKNQSTSRSRYSIFGHFVPTSLGFSWRGTDFSHGVYADRHSVY
ncbi:unnamed protein product [Polarella glacialis]|uniref:N-acetyltransferase domain-containing protein n=1 Tax=Polarella glacialis TaxID=89957 RepID=A0A813HPR2_POLGL|nr:unnamed protein product [Polarella glacialis]